MAAKISVPNVQKHPPTMLIVLDGFGLAPADNPGNAITPKTAPNIFSYMKKYPSTTLKAHGKDVGLRPNQQGNSEAGHFNIGAGRVVEQDLVRITHAIKDGTFLKNEAFHHAISHANDHNAAVHVMGLLTNGQSAHASPEHLYAILEYLRIKKQRRVYLHLFTDGRDSSPHGAIRFLRDLRKNMNNGEEIATIGGRFYGMDRNKMWERTEKAYNAMVLGKGCAAESAEEAVSQAYNRNETDEYICPSVIIKNGKPVATIQDHDVIFFFNARSDRARQITKAFVQKDFNKKNPGSFTRKKLPKIPHFVAMTDFGPDLQSILTAFPSPNIENPLAKAIGEERRQLYISETEKYAHVTYFINGGYAEPVNGEDRILVPSPKKYSHANKPEMSAKKLTNTILQFLKKERYDFIAVNYPNVDMVGHTGNFEAAKKAVTVVDDSVKQLVDEVLARNGQVLLTADHGNAEEMINKKTGEIMTEHTTNPVPCILITKKKKGIHLTHGRLADIAPTLLNMMNIPKPKEMKGEVLF